MKHNVKHFMMILAVIVLIACFAVQKIVARKDTLSYLQQIDEKIVSFETLPGECPTYLITDNEGRQSYITETTASGYGGPLTLLTQFDLEGTILCFVIANHCETPLYLNKVLKADLWDQFIGKQPGDPFAISDADSISGATMSAEAIRAASQKAAVNIGKYRLGMEIQMDTASIPDSTSVILLLFYIAVVLVSYCKYIKARPYILAASVLVLGFNLKTFLSYANFVSLITGNFPSFAERPSWHLLVFGVLLITLIGGRNLYCTYLCPFGAVQEGIYRALHLTQLNPDRRLVRISKMMRWVVIWLALAIALLINRPGIAAYEPFGVFFNAQGGTGQWIIMAVVLVLCIWWFRLWCKYFCPVGAILDVISSVKNKAIRRKSVPEKTPWENKTEEESSSAKPENYECSGQCAKQKALSSSDKVFLVVLICLNVLIIHTIISAVLAL